MSLSYTDISASLEEFSEACKEYKPHGIAWQAGWFQSMCTRLIWQLNDQDQQQEIEMLKEQIEEMQKQHLFDQLSQ